MFLLVISRGAGGGGRREGCADAGVGVGAGGRGTLGGKGGLLGVLRSFNRYDFIRTRRERGAEGGKE